ncbi:MAG TPA: hypothetical protein DD381_09095 [Lentisphaeria bacterium]|nr:MAG: hypothetical protein A2X47_07765 [Lentisphaerae bacterium GWF2_38_69]HBM16478.1 hypothetical protein [Lentisphaeria bacterium]
MNIISGVARGIRLEVPNGLSVRPTSVLARKSLFDSIRNFQNFTVVDLFAGSGALGLEAASRGASSVYFFENSKLHSEFLKANIEKVIKSGVAANLKQIKADALEAHKNIPEIAGKIDLIFADPPYNISSEVLDSLLNDDGFSVWAGDALFIFEMPSESSRRPRLENIKLWSIVGKRSFGQSVFIFLKIIS